MFRTCVKSNRQANHLCPLPLLGEGRSEADNRPALFARATLDIAGRSLYDLDLTKLSINPFEQTSRRSPALPPSRSRASITAHRNSPFLIDRESWPNTISATPYSIPDTP